MRGSVRPLWLDCRHSNLHDVGIPTYVKHHSQATLQLKPISLRRHHHRTPKIRSVVARIAGQIGMAGHWGVCVRREIPQHMGGNRQHQASPRSRAIKSSVRHFTSALPRAASKRSGIRLGRAPTLRITTSPSVFTAKSTEHPGNMPKASRICLGMVTWPLLVSVVDPCDPCTPILRFSCPPQTRSPSRCAPSVRTPDCSWPETCRHTHPAKHSGLHWPCGF